MLFLSTLLFIIAIAPSSADETLCDKLNNNDFHLNALTVNRSEAQIWLIESYLLYIIPWTNLDTSADLLRLYDNKEGMPIETVGQWSALDWLRVLEGSKKTDLEWMSILGDDQYRYIKFKDTYYVIEAARGYQCDSYDQKVMPWRLASFPFGQEGGELWAGLKQTGRVRRVIFTKVHMKVVDKTKKGCTIVEFNFPGEDTAHFTPIPPQHPYVFLETNAKRTKATFKPASASKSTSYYTDLFAQPPAVIATDTKLYMFDLQLKRVYIINSTDLMVALEQGVSRSFPVISKSWSAFFICSPNTAPPSPGTEPNQAQYMAGVGDLYPREQINLWEWVQDYAEELAFTIMMILVANTARIQKFVKGIFRKKRSQKKESSTTKTKSKSRTPKHPTSSSSSRIKSRSPGKTPKFSKEKLKSAKSKQQHCIKSKKSSQKPAKSC